MLSKLMARRSLVDGGFVTALMMIVLWASVFCAACAAWITHVVWVIQKLASDGGVTVGQIILGILGAVVPPVGVIHGIILWVS